jgi:ppGpp synthetase/RelA/SpoT-type nucleotidyltranferase
MVMRKNRNQGFLGFVRSKAAILRMRSVMGRHVKGLHKEMQVRVKIVPESGLLHEMSRYKKRKKKDLKGDALAKSILGEKPFIVGKNLESHKKFGLDMIRKMGQMFNVTIIKAEGRVKDSESLRKKLMKNTTFHRMLTAQTKERQIQLMQELQKEWIGLRVVVPTERELRKLTDILRQMKVEYTDKKSGNKVSFGEFDLKDYVSEPRKDGLILGEDPKDEYRGIHIFTNGLTGAPMEIQIWTADMEKNVAKLREKYATKYGATYWKSPEFRRMKKSLGDSR